jgi:hypothetical protein
MSLCTVAKGGSTLISALQPYEEGQCQSSDAGCAGAFVELAEDEERGEEGLLEL